MGGHRAALAILALLTTLIFGSTSTPKACAGCPATAGASAPMALTVPFTGVLPPDPPPTTTTTTAPPPPAPPAPVYPTPKPAPRPATTTLPKAPVKAVAPLAAPTSPPPPPAAGNGQVIAVSAADTGVNQLRAANGVAPLAWDPSMLGKAVSWAHHIADAGALSHSTLSSGMPAGWHTLGENVAVSPSLQGAFAALEASPPHRANILDARFTRFAVGVVLQNGRYWVVEEFLG